MKFYADLHIHSKYSMATSKNMDLQGISEMAKLKGIRLMGTGDFTHPIWFSKLEENLTSAANGLFEYNGVNFMLTCEVCNIYVKNGKYRKNHNIILTPSFESAENISEYFSKYGKIESNGRPILSLDAEMMFEKLKKIDERVSLIPAHIWTPWFSLFGSKSGFDSIEDCFGALSDDILALETGLSSDPAMNWTWSKLDKYTLVSNSDAHSPINIGREANCFDCDMDYDTIIQTIKEGDSSSFLYTVEFFPEEGKYHFDGHRACNVSLHPEQTLKKGINCPKCGKKLTLGVLHRTMQLADREFGYKPKNKKPFKKLVPLTEIIAKTLKHGKGTKLVEEKYLNLIARLGPELEILLEQDYEDIKKVADEPIATAIQRVRTGEIKIKPGYDGVYGEVSLTGKMEEKEQLEFF